MAINVNLTKAIKAVQNGMDIREASQKFGVKEQELSNALNPKGGGKPEDSFSKNYDINFPLKGGKKVKVARLATQKLPSGRSVEAFIDKNGKQYFQYRAADGKVIKEEYFRKVENFKGEYHVNNGKFETGIKLNTPSQAELDKKRADYKKSMKDNIKNKKWGKAFADAYNYTKTPEKAGLQKANGTIITWEFGPSGVSAGAVLGATAVLAGAVIGAYLLEPETEIKQDVKIEIKNGEAPPKEKIFTMTDDEYYYQQQFQ